MTKMRISTSQGYSRDLDSMMKIHLRRKKRRLDQMSNLSMTGMVQPIRRQTTSKRSRTLPSNSGLLKIQTTQTNRVRKIGLRETLTKI